MNSTTFYELQKYGHLGGKRTLVSLSILASKLWISSLMLLQKFGKRLVYLPHGEGKVKKSGLDQILIQQQFMSFKNMDTFGVKGP